ncbi:MAG: ATP-dependent zinc metalloprotease FtsH [Bacteroidetes bacterium]|nr:ATP-dependent zinc metalloprotease FtsH [Bacteroidota bacterium]
MTDNSSYNPKEGKNKSEEKGKPSWDPFNKPSDNPPDQEDKKKTGRPRFNFYWIYAILIVGLIGMQYFSFTGEVKEIEWSTFQELIAKHDIQKIMVINNKVAEIYIKKDRLVSGDTLFKDVKTRGFGNSINPGPHFAYKFLTVDIFNKDIKEAQDRAIAKDTAGKTPDQIQEIKDKNRLIITPNERRNWSGDILSYILPIVILVGAWFLLMRMMNRGGGGAGQIFNFGKSKAQLFDKNTTVSITFLDVAGLEEAKVEVMEIVDFLKNPKKYTQLGGKIPKGALLVGPPGTGKTLLAKAVAGEAKVPFFSISGSDFVEMFVGVGASRVRDLFKQAKEKAPCIIFIDEIDAIGRARGKNIMTGSNDERENTLNQLLTEMDGFASNAGVIILAATNRADVLDRALLRAGRFDRTINVELPDIEERKAIFAVHMRPLKMDNSINVEFLAKQTPGFSGADIANVCNESALIAARKGKEIIEKQDFLDAIDRIVGGLEKRTKIISPAEKRVIAFHEAGHASISWLLEHAHPLVKVTIVPRGKALGAAWYLPEERQITTFDQMFDELTAALGGRAAEQVIFGKISTGALNDLEKVTKSAYAMIAYFGLNEKIGNISFYDSTGQSEYSFGKPYSEKTAETIDNEVHLLVEKAYDRARQKLRENREKVEALADILLKKEVIFREDLEAIFGKRPFDLEREDLPGEAIPLPV